MIYLYMYIYLSGAQWLFFNVFYLSKRVWRRSDRRGLTSLLLRASEGIYYLIYVIFFILFFKQVVNKKKPYTSATRHVNGKTIRSIVRGIISKIPPILHTYLERASTNRVRNGLIIFFMPASSGGAVIIFTRRESRRWGGGRYNYYLLDRAHGGTAVMSDRKTISEQNDLIMTVKRRLQRWRYGCIK